MSDVDAFVAHMRHELRTPINAILGYSQLLLEEEDRASLSPAERRDLERVADSGKQLLRIISDVLDPVESRDDIAEYAVRLRHAMRTPLTEVQGYIESLLEEHENAPVADDLRRIHVASARLSELIDTVEHTYRVRVGANHDTPPTVSGPSRQSKPRATWRAVVVRFSSSTTTRPTASCFLAGSSHQGHSVLTAETGEAGLAIAAREPVDVILLDVLMPGSAAMKSSLGSKRMTRCETFQC